MMRHQTSGILLFHALNGSANVPSLDSFLRNHDQVSSEADIHRICAWSRHHPTASQTEEWFILDCPSAWSFTLSCLFLSQTQAVIREVLPTLPMANFTLEDIQTAATAANLSLPKVVVKCWQLQRAITGPCMSDSVNSAHSDLRIDSARQIKDGTIDPLHLSRLLEQRAKRQAVRDEAERIAQLKPEERTAREQGKLDRRLDKLNYAREYSQSLRDEATRISEKRPEDRSEEEQIKLDKANEVKENGLARQKNRWAEAKRIASMRPEDRSKEEQVQLGRHEGRQNRKNKRAADKKAQAELAQQKKPEDRTEEEQKVVEERSNLLARKKCITAQQAEVIEAKEPEDRTEQEERDLLQRKEYLKKRKEAVITAEQAAAIEAKEPEDRTEKEVLDLEKRVAYLKKERARSARRSKK